MFYERTQVPSTSLLSHSLTEPILRIHHPTPVGFHQQHLDQDTHITHHFLTRTKPRVSSRTSTMTVIPNMKSLDEVRTSSKNLLTDHTPIISSHQGSMEEARVINLQNSKLSTTICPQSPNSNTSSSKVTPSNKHLATLTSRMLVNDRFSQHTSLKCSIQTNS